MQRICPACSKEFISPDVKISGRSVCTKCFNEYRIVKEAGREKANEWLNAKLKHRPCEDRSGSGSIGSRL